MSAATEAGVQGLAEQQLTWVKSPRAPHFPRTTVVLELVVVVCARKDIGVVR